MNKSLTDSRPGKALRWALRLPIYLYQARLGWLLADRFLMLTHTGRKSGRRHQSVIEVVQHNRETDTYFVVSGWGAKADWYRNVQKDPRVIVNVGRRRYEALAEPVPFPEALTILKDYARLHPIAFKEIGRLFFGPSVSLDAEAIVNLARKMPMIALRPKDA